eukprot:SM001830S04168  [mRNA]  locus=s1830:631:1783:+ [translate_table: standard]
MVFYFKVRPEAGDLVIYMGLDKFENEDLIKYGLPEDVWSDSTRPLCPPAARQAAVLRCCAGQTLQLPPPPMPRPWRKRFHVDKLSSAHVYLRLNKGQTIEAISDEMLEDCAQLVKANSIQGTTNVACALLASPDATCSPRRPLAVLSCVTAVRSCGVLPGNKLNNLDVVYTPWSNLKKAPSMDIGQVGFHNPKLQCLCTSAKGWGFAQVRTVRVEKRLNDVVNRLNKSKVERTPDLKGSEREAYEAAERATRKAQLRDKVGLV